MARKESVIEAIEVAIRKSGGLVIQRPSPHEAPFEFRIEMPPSGERVSVVCYAFLANKYRQEGRPFDEHRFQVKYGSDFQNYHELFIDPSREIVTLMFGVHIEEDIFIAIDPAMHNPTWFSRSVEFKSQHCSLTQSHRWFGWERERSDGRRKQVRPLENLQTEALLGFTSENFLRYAQFERLATGLDTAERLSLIDHIGQLVGNVDGAHPLERAFDLSAREILDLIWGANRLTVAVKGSVAEHHLNRHLANVSGIQGIRQLDEDGRPDFEVRFRGRPYLIECKNVLRRSSLQAPRVDFQKTRASKGDPCSRYYERGAFHVLAACLYPVAESWTYKFASTSQLDAHPNCDGRLSQRVTVEGDRWTPNIEDLLS